MIRRLQCWLHGHSPRIQAVHYADGTSLAIECDHCEKLLFEVWRAPYRESVSIVPPEWGDALDR